MRYRDEGRQVEISYGLAQNAWGRGLTTEAALAALDQGFRVIGLGETTAIAKASNLASHQGDGKTWRASRGDMEPQRYWPG